MKRKLLALIISLALAAGNSGAMAFQPEKGQRQVLDLLFEKVAQLSELNLTPENMEFNDAVVTCPPETAEEFLKLIAAQARLSVLMGFINEHRNELLFNAATLGTLLPQLPPDAAPTLDMADQIILQFVKPLQLERLVDALLRAYDAVMADADWGDKFFRMSEELNRTPDCDLNDLIGSAGFPHLWKDSIFWECQDFYLKDNDTVILSQASTSVESWIYSFWVRRYMEGSLSMVHTALQALQNRLAEGSPIGAW